MYRIIYEKRIFKDLGKIPNLDLEKILITFKEISENPVSRKIKKLQGKPELYRIRCGNYRIIYAIDQKEKTVKIILISHRKEAYRKL